VLRFLSCPFIVAQTYSNFIVFQAFKSLKTAVFAFPKECFLSSYHRLTSPCDVGKEKRLVFFFSVFFERFFKVILI